MIWVFGYGSLIWNPAFDYDEMRTGTLHGYHRQFCFWSKMAVAHLKTGHDGYTGLRRVV